MAKDKDRPAPIRASWRQILIEMRKSDEGWENAIIMAGGPYGRYKNRAVAALTGSSPRYTRLHSWN